MRLERATLTGRFLDLDEDGALLLDDAAKAAAASPPARSFPAASAERSGPMLLAINANNTNTSFAIWDGAALKGSWRTATEGKRTADEYVVWLDHLLALEGLSRARCRRRGDRQRRARGQFQPVTFCRKYCRDRAAGRRRARASTLGTRALVDRPEEVGADRLVNTVAAHDRYKGPLIVVDFGTATTLDVVDGDGNYCGGVIAPGINLSLAALHMAAAKLPSVRISRTERVIGKDTVSCMQSGIYWGYIGLVEGLVGAHQGRVRRADAARSSPPAGWRRCSPARPRRSTRSTPT